MSPGICDYGPSLLPEPLMLGCGRTTRDVLTDSAPALPEATARRLAQMPPAAYAGVAEAYAHHATLALEAATERDNLNRAVAAGHRVGLDHGILMRHHQITAEQAFTLLRRQSQNTHVKLRTIAQTFIQTGDLPANGRSKTR